MSIRRLALCTLAGSLFGPVLLAAAQSAAPAPKLELAQILEKNAAARGGLDAWRKVHTMVWSGHVERADGARLPFMFEQKRPNLTRFEILADKQKSVRVFDGKAGWKLRASAAGQPEVQPYTEDERRAASDALVIDGPVLDAGAKGVELTLDGADEVEGRKAWRLRAKLPSGTIQRVWIDAETFLEIMYDRPARAAGGGLTTVPVYLRNYQTYQGLRVPFAIETRTAGVAAVGDTLVIDRIAIDVALPDGMFARPGLRTARRGITVDVRDPQPGRAEGAVPGR